MDTDLQAALALICVWRGIGQAGQLVQHHVRELHSTHSMSLWCL